MDCVSLERQLAALRRQHNRLSRDDAVGLWATEQTLMRLLSLRQHLQNADHDPNEMADELLSLLSLPRS